MLDLTKFKEDCISNKNYFNHVVGIVSFSISLACLSFDNPQKMALFSLPIIMSLLLGAPEFQSTKEYRELVRFADNEKDKELLMRTFSEKVGSPFKLKDVFQMGVYLYGVMFYFVVLTLEDVSVYLKSVNWSF
ncbi:hypothetical protein [Vibrio sinaloensis]|uniref:hypothetical protein n=1 Tax=Photobacterium sp. (strain ATCC 43367) TaxID=379097 RepID=UPI000580538D|nr:hypothetical protein [Vibrio sinaloensis]KHT39174.1 hypothetical protein RJ47_16765 [Vibrio sinaloensis]